MTLHNMRLKHAIAALFLPTVLLMPFACQTAHAQALSVIKLENKAYTPAGAQAPVVARNTNASEGVRPKEISIYVKDVSFYSLLSRLAARLDYTLSASSDVDLDRQITLDLHLTPIEDAMRLIAFKTGYAVTVNEVLKTVYLQP